MSFKILIAEDEPLMLMAIEARLKKDGFTVQCTTDGQEAIKALDSFLPDLVITDILMPYTSGLEVIGVVRSRHQTLPIIVLSGIGEEETVLEAFNLGADDFITKPFNPSELSVRVKRLLKIPAVTQP